MAEMPDVYGEDNFDLVGAITGVVEKEHILDGSDVGVGDVLLGLPSTGIHTNGYTLARTVLFDSYAVEDRPSVLGGETVGEALLRVHRSYLAPIRTLIEAGGVQGFAHVTGGGLPGNLGRILPDGCSAHINYDAWRRPPLFSLIQEAGDVPEEDMRRTFNLGIGLVAVVSSDQVEAVQRLLDQEDESHVVIGEVTADDRASAAGGDAA